LFSIFPTALLNPGPDGHGAVNNDAAAPTPSELSLIAEESGKHSMRDGTPVTLPSPFHSALAIQSLDHYASMNGAENFLPKIENGFPRVAIATMSAMAGRLLFCFFFLIHYTCCCQQADRMKHTQIFPTGSLGPQLYGARFPTEIYTRGCH
jgi:hypothetical protein